MDYVTLGRTGLKTSVFGLGGGGHSRLGQRTGATHAQSLAIVRRALELGVNFIDTAEVYGTEGLIGEALQGVARQNVIISTKKALTHEVPFITGAELMRGLEASLRRLRTDYVDIYHLHGVHMNQYDHAVNELTPAMLKLRDQGKVRWLGITESFANETTHATLSRAARDNHWDVVMVGFNILNQTARENVFTATRQHDIGGLCMFAVRDTLSQPENLKQTVAELVEAGLVDKDAVDLQDPLGFLKGISDSIPDAAYRFCRAEPGIHVVLSGTGNIKHLEQNIASVLRPPLPDDARQKLIDLFGAVDNVSGEQRSGSWLMEAAQRIKSKFS